MSLNKDLIYKILNQIFFQAGWFAAVLYNRVDIALICVFLNLFFPKINIRTAIAIIASVLIGICNDLILKKLGVIIYTGALIPLWLVSAWMLFISSWHSSFIWVLNLNPFLRSVLFAVGGTLSYFSGYKLGSINLDLNKIYLLSLSWMILGYLQINVYKYLKRG